MRMASLKKVRPDTEICRALKSAGSISARDRNTSGNGKLASFLEVTD